MVRAPIRCLLVVLACFVAGGCDDPSRTPVYPTAPSPATNAPDPSANAPRVVRIVSGGNAEPVVGASVMIDGRTYSTDQTGMVVPDVPPDGPGSIDIDAPGYLKRQTRIPAAGSLITLWPVANDAEAQALREMVYRRGRSSDQVLYPPYDDEPFYVTLEGTSSREIHEAWQAGANAFGAVFSLHYEVRSWFGYDQNELTVRLGGGAGCTPAAVLGFCTETSSYKIVNVLPEKALDTQTIHRAVASWFLGPNPLPGFMNPNTPDDELSPLEVQTIRMILQRDRPNRWPDNDR